MAAVFETEDPINTVHIDGLAVLKIVKHCQESLPSQVTGSLLGLAVGDGILEITHAFPFPKADHKSSAPDKTDDDDGAPDAAANEASTLDGDEFQLEMMKMFREVNIDNNCIGWYKSIYLGSLFDSNSSNLTSSASDTTTLDLLENHFDYQTSLSPNAVVVVYDPVQAKTTPSNTNTSILGLKCLRLTKTAMEHLQERKNTFLNPMEIFEELPLKIKNPAMVKALLHSVKTGDYYADDEDGENEEETKTGGVGGAAEPTQPTIYDADMTFDRLDLSTNPYLEKHLQFLCSWVDDLASEQSKFQYYMRTLSRNAAASSADASRGKFDKRKKEQDKVVSIDADAAWASQDAPRRLNSLLVSSQIRTYCDQVDRFADGGLGKLFLANSLHREEESK